MDAQTFLLTMYNKLKARYTQYTFELKNCAVTMHSPGNGINLCIFKYLPFTDEIIFHTIDEHEIPSFTGHKPKHYFGESIDRYKVDFYNIENDNMDYLVENLFGNLISNQFKAQEEINKDFV